MEGESAWRDGICLRASSTAALIQEMIRLRQELQTLVEEQRDDQSKLKVQECFDGVWSQNLKESVRLLNATGLVVNENWTMLPPSWICPCCKRPKSDLVILVNGVAHAHIVDHHDHFTSRINKAFKSALGENWTRSHPGASDLHASIMENFLSFSNVMICQNCNHADGEAKSILRIKLGISTDDLDDISFSVEEIAQFINIKPNLNHTISENKLIDLFTKKRKLDVLRFRRNTVDEQVKFFQEGTHWKAVESHPSGDDIYGFAIDCAMDLDLVPSSNFNIFTYSSTTRIGKTASNAWRRNRGRGRHVRMPSPNQADEFILSNDNLKEFGFNWRCPCCQRSLRRVVRYSKKGSLTAKIRNIGPYSNSTLVCMDCADVADGLAGEAETPREDVTIEDVFGTILTKAHMRHGLRSDVGTDRVVMQIRDRHRASNGQPSGEPRSNTEYISIF